MTPLVQSYSLQLKADSSSDLLSQSLAFVAVEEQKEIEKGRLSEQEWRGWLQYGESFSDADRERLNNRCKEAVKLWKDLCRRSHNGSDLEVFNIPSLEKLSAATNKMISDRKSHHQSSFHVAKESFLDFVNVMSDYSYIFSVFPSGEKYTSVITGVLSTIAKAAANHRRTTEMFSTALVKIAENLRLVSKYHKIVQTTDSRRHFVDIYLSIFEFLCFAMSWYGSRGKMFWSAINKNFIDNDVNPRIDAVKEAVARFYDETKFVTFDEVHKIAPQVDHLSSEVSNLKSDFSDMRHNLMSDLGDLLADKLDVFRLAGPTADHLVSVEQSATYARDCGRALLESDSDEIKSSNLDGTPLNAETHLISIEHDPFATIDRLNPFIDNGRDSLIDEYRALTRPILPEEVIDQMQDWIRDPTSRMVWVEGVEVYSGPLLSMAALYIHSTFEATGVPCISHFCRYPFRSHSNLSSGEALFISLLYSIVAQLSEMLEIDFSTSANKELRDCLLQLDGGIESSKSALRLIQELMPQLPYMTVWIVDDIYLTETESTLPYLEDLFEILRNKSSESVVKVLFTTKGNSRLLCSNLQVTERVDASRMAQERGGHFMPGGASFY